jgi:anaphase-promoting complex subunit 3
MAYAHTLCGLEYMNCEDLDKALVCFRTAVSLESKHFNGWYGIAMIYLRQGKFPLSEFHFKKAIEINTTNSVLHCFLGISLLGSKKYEDAITSFDYSIKLDPRNTLAKFKRASSFIHLGKYEDALLELQSLKDIVPKEAAIYFSLGKVYKHLNDTQKALTCYTTAMDFDVKNSSVIKVAIDRLTSGENGGEDEEFDLLDL